MPLQNDNLKKEINSAQIKIHNSIASILKRVSCTTKSKNREYQAVVTENNNEKKLIDQMLSKNAQKTLTDNSITFKDDNESTLSTSSYSDISPERLRVAKLLLRVLHSHPHGKNGLLAHSAYAALGGAVTAGVLTAAYAGTASKVAALAAYTLPKLMQLIHQQPTVAALAVSVTVVISLVSLICAAATASVKASSAATARHQLDHFKTRTKTSHYGYSSLKPVSAN